MEKCRNNTFGALTKKSVLKTMTKNNTSVLELLMFHETIAKNPKEALIVFSCVIYTTIDNYVCIYYLACQ